MLPKKVFIFTPSSGFGELIRQVLEDTGGYKPFLFSMPKEAIEWAAKEAVALIILDAEISMLATPSFIAELRGQAPHAKLVILPTEENPLDPSLKEYAADAILPSPFYLPDLVAVIEQFFGPLVPRDTPKRSSYGDAATHILAPVREAGEAPAWLEDVSQAAGYLTRLSLESASRAALITRAGSVWAYAGELPSEAADELSTAVAEHAATGNGADLARFIHLKATGVDYMLYATSLGGDYTLALAFDAQMPFSQMRAQVNEVAKAIATAPLKPIGDRAELKVDAEQKMEVRSQQGAGGPPPTPPTASEPLLERAAPKPAAADHTPGAESAPDATVDLYYSFVLIPRLPKHKLEGDLAERLAEWLPELCLAFAWRLERISVNTDFLQWMISIPTDFAPEDVAQTLDAHLSDKIFEEFPRLEHDNPSGHFWAPGYFILSAAQPTQTQVSEYIQHTRARQGVPR